MDTQLFETFEIDQRDWRPLQLLIEDGVAPPPGLAKKLRCRENYRDVLNILLTRLSQPLWREHAARLPGLSDSLRQHDSVSLEA